MVIVIMCSITYIYKYVCRDGCNLRTLVVRIKALHRIKRLQGLSGGGVTHHELAEKRVYRRSGYLVIHNFMIVLMHSSTCIYKLGKIID